MREGLNTAIMRDSDGFVVDAALVAARFNMSVEGFRSELRNGRIVTVCERGTDEDEGRTRLTFRRGALLWRFIIEADGAIHEDPVLAKTAPRHAQK